MKGKKHLSSIRSASQGLLKPAKTFLGTNKNVSCYTHYEYYGLPILMQSLTWRFANRPLILIYSTNTQY